MVDVRLLALQAHAVNGSLELQQLPVGFRLLLLQALLGVEPLLFQLMAQSMHRGLQLPGFILTLSYGNGLPLACQAFLTFQLVAQGLHRAAELLQLKL